MNRIQRGLKTAGEAARFVTHTRLRTGAALYFGNRLISIGWNMPKTHPDADGIFNWQHAETNCLIGNHKVDISKGTLYVARISVNGEYRIAKPCGDCVKMLRASGLRRVWFTNRRGEAEQMRL